MAPKQKDGDEGDDNDYEDDYGGGGSDGDVDDDDASVDGDPVDLNAANSNMIMLKMIIQVVSFEEQDIEVEQLTKSVCLHFEPKY